MSVGELAKKMHTTVRTLQYYDKEKLLCPSSQSEGGRRLYTHKDMIKLHQIQSLKSLGFSLEEIKNKLMPLDTPEEIAAILSKQALTIQDQIQQLSKSLQEIKLLKEEVLQMQQVDFKKYADIIVNLQMNNQYYWLIKHFDDSTLDHIRHRFNKDTGLSFIHRFNQLIEEILILKDNNVSLYFGIFTIVISSFIHLMIMSFIIFIAAPIIFHASAPENIPLYFFTLALFIIVSLSLSCVLGLAIKNQAKLTMFSQIVFLPSIMLSGIMFPASFLPDLLETIGKIFPATWGYTLLCQLDINFFTFIPLLIIFSISFILILFLLKKAQSES